MFAVTTLKFKKRYLSKVKSDGMANSVDPDQTAPRTDLGLHCLPRLVCPKTKDHYGIT